jgi:hypothetical protein
MTGDREVGLRPRRLSASAKEPPATGDGRARLPGAWLARLPARWRPGRDRAAGYVAVAAVAALAATTALVGIGAAGARPLISDIGAWLANSNGSVAHANGTTGQVDGRVKIDGTAGHKLQISQDGRSVLVLDERTRRLVRIDPSQLTVAAAKDYSKQYSGTGLSMVARGGAAYLVGYQDGTVQQVDPRSLVPKGPRRQLGLPAGKALVDSEGTLWVPLRQGQVVPVRDGTPGPPVKVSPPNRPLALTLAAGQPVVVDPAGPTVTLLSPTGTRQQVNLSSAVAASDPAKTLAPDATEDLTVPVLAIGDGGSGVLAVADLAAGSLRTATVEARGHRLGAPQLLAGRVYIPDQDAGSLIVYNVAAGQFEGTLGVTGQPGEMEAFVRNGLLWVNDQNAASALVVDSDGVARRVGKYETKAPDNSRKKTKPVPRKVEPPPVSRHPNPRRLARRRRRRRRPRRPLRRSRLQSAPWSRSRPRNRPQRQPRNRPRSRPGNRPRNRPCR